MSAPVVDTHWVLQNVEGIGSRATLHRRLNDPDHPFPAGMRHRLSNRRYWRLDDVRAWEAKERTFRSERLQANLVPDSKALRDFARPGTRAA